MSYLAIEQLENNVTVSQEIRLLKSTNLEAIRLNLLKQGILTDGVLSIDIYDGINLLGSMSLSHSELNTVGTNFHGMIRFLPSTVIAIRKLPTQAYLTLTLNIRISSHTDSDSAFIGLIKEPNPIVEQYNLDNNPNLSDEDPALDIWYRPYGIEIYSN